MGWWEQGKTAVHPQAVNASMIFPAWLALLLLWQPLEHDWQAGDMVSPVMGVPHHISISNAKSCVYSLKCSEGHKWELVGSNNLFSIGLAMMNCVYPALPMYLFMYSMEGGRIHGRHVLYSGTAQIGWCNTLLWQHMTKQNGEGKPHWLSER